jgi:hypothetical protein
MELKGGVVKSVRPIIIYVSWNAINQRVSSKTSTHLNRGVELTPLVISCPPPSRKLARSRRRSGPETRWKS